MSPLLLALVLLWACPVQAWFVQYLTATGDVTGIREAPIPAVPGYSVLETPTIPPNGTCAENREARYYVVTSPGTPEAALTVRPETGCLTGAWHPAGDYTLHKRDAKDATRDQLLAARDRLIDRRPCPVLNREAEASCAGDNTAACTEYRTDTAAICAAMDALIQAEGY